MTDTSGFSSTNSCINSQSTNEQKKVFEDVEEKEAASAEKLTHRNKDDPMSPIVNENAREEILQVNNLLMLFTKN